MTLVSKNICPPSFSISSLIFLTTTLRISVPTWGFCLYAISAGAPNLISSPITFFILTSFIPVVSLPSEKAPAPPSPNWTLDSGSRVPPCQKLSTSEVRLSTSLPRSTIMGRSPACAKIKEAKIPAGPKPITAGRRADFALGRTSGISYLICGAFSSLSLLSVSKSTE